MPLSLYRSETVKYGTIVTTRESAHETVATLGRHANIFFMDDNADVMVRPYQNVLQRIELMERQLNSIFEHLRRIPSLNISQANADEFLLDRPHKLTIDFVAMDLDKHFKQMNVFQLNHESLRKDKSSLIEEYIFLKVTYKKRPYTLSLDSNNSPKEISLSNEEMAYSPRASSENEKSITFAKKTTVSASPISVPFERKPTMSLYNSSAIDTMHSTHLSVLAGSVSSEAHARFLRLVLALARRNVFVSSEKMEISEYEKLFNEKVSLDKHIFFIYYHGSNDSFLHQSLVHLCETFEVCFFSVAITMSELEQRIRNVQAALTEKQNAITAYENFIKYEFEDLLSVPIDKQNCILTEWKLFILEEKALYMTLNKFQGSGVIMRCNCWVLEKEEEEIRQLLSANVRNASLLADEKNSTNLPPPSYFRTNDFVAPSQLIVDTFGVPRYKEVNPGLFTIIPYPFLFGIMFGDAGHGLVLFIFGLYLAFRRKETIGPLFQSLWNFRYMIILMGFFSLFAGLLYNEFFGLGMNLFGSRWVREGEVVVSASDRFPYPFGIDPEWRAARNELVFTNSFKMKFSIIVGFVQMFLGICLRGVNAAYFRLKRDFYLTFVPHLVFFTGFVGYLVFLIVFKWVTPVESFAKPNLLNVFVDMFLFNPILPENQLYTSQAVVQSFIVYILIACIPIMFFIRPLADILFLKKKQSMSDKIKKKQIADTLHASERNEDSHLNYTHTVSLPLTDPFTSKPESKKTLERQVTVTEITGSVSSKSKAAATAVVGEETSVGSIFTHSMIETMEFLLGTLSNTASYLRLWALSLAHMELSKIILEQIFFNFLFATENPVLLPILLFVGTIIFVFATVMIILMLDLIEGALHALRLQWVEFQNKFYAGDGYAFVPLSFRKAFLSAIQEGEEKDQKTT